MSVQIQVPMNMELMLIDSNNDAINGNILNIYGIKFTKEYKTETFFSYLKY